MDKGLLLREILPSLDFYGIEKECVSYTATVEHVDNINNGDYVVIKFRHDGLVDFLLYCQKWIDKKMGVPTLTFENPTASDLYCYVEKAYKEKGLRYEK